MPQQTYLRLSHLVPPGYPPIYPGMSTKVREMMPGLLKMGPRRWMKIPGHNDLEMLAQQEMNVPILAFRKNHQEIYMHIFCNEFMSPFYAIQIVGNLYIKFKLGDPTFLPGEPNWIHSIPVPGPKLNEEENLLMHQITQSFFWTIHTDYKRDKKQI